MPVKKILILFEFATPNYREFFINWAKTKYGDVSIVCANDKFSISSQTKATVLRFFIGKGETRFYMISPRHFIGRDIIITTFNMRRPHTWIYIFIFPYKKWILWGQGTWKTNNFFIDSIRRSVLKLSDGYVVYTKEGKERLIGYGYPEKNISVADNTFYISNSKITDGHEYFLYVGRIQKRKQIEAVFPYLADTNIKLRIVGDGDYKDSIKENARLHGASENIEIFPGTFDEEELLKHFSGAIAYISPSAVGLGVVHAFAYGIPVLTLKDSNHGPEFSYCDDNNSYLCESMDELINVINNIESHSKEHQVKKRLCHQYYSNHLTAKNFFSAFEYHMS